MCFNTIYTCLLWLFFLLWLLSVHSLLHRFHYCPFPTMSTFKITSCIEQASAFVFVSRHKHMCTYKQGKTYMGNPIPWEHAQKSTAPHIRRIEYIIIMPRPTIVFNFYYYPNNIDIAHSFTTRQLVKKPTPTPNGDTSTIASS